MADLVGRGRYPHQGALRQWSSADEQAVRDAMAATNIGELADHYVDELSGGQRQRVWLAMALAQQTALLLLDEPTTFLDIAHQLDVLDLCAELHESGRTLVAVLHDLNHACRYASHLIAMHSGRALSPLDVGGKGGAPASSGPAAPGGATQEAPKEPSRGGVLDSLEKGRERLPQVPKSQ